MVGFSVTRCCPPDSGGKKKSPHFALAAVLSIQLFQVATAQTVNRADLELCAGLETSELKLVCFEAIIAASKMEEFAGVTETRSPGPKGENHTNLASDPIELQAPVSAATVKPARTRSDSDGDFGEEHLEQPAANKEREVVIAIVTDVRRARNKKLYFELASGQVWRQMESGYIQYPREGNFEIRITKGMMGDYQLRVGGKGRMTRIVRVE